MKEKKNMDNVRPYPQSILCMTFNANKLNPSERRCYFCDGNEFVVGTPVFMPNRHPLKAIFQLSFSFCFFSCIKKYILVFSPLISLQGDTLNAFIRDIYKLRLLFFPSPDLYEHVDYQWLPSFSGAIKYNKKEFTYGGINLVRAYDEEENSNYQTEKEILEHLLHFRETKIQKSTSVSCPQKAKIAIELPPLEKMATESRFAELYQTNTEPLTAYVVRTHLAKPTIIFSNELDSFFIQCAYACKDLPFWMIWRTIEECYKTKKLEFANWRTWLMESEGKKYYSRTNELFKKWNKFIPLLKDDEWAQLLPSIREYKMYESLLDRKLSTSLKCYYCKKFLNEQPFFFPLAYYPTVDQFVFETKFCFCSPQCNKKWLQEQKAYDYKEYTLLITSCTLRRWNCYYFQCQCSPAISLLPKYSDPLFSAFEEKKTYLDYVEKEDKEKNQFNENMNIFSGEQTFSLPGEIEKWWKAEKLGILSNLRYFNQSIRKNTFQPPQTYNEFNLLLSLNTSVFEIIYKPFYPQYYHLYPKVSDVFPYGVTNYGPHLNYQLGTFQPESES